MKKCNLKKSKCKIFAAAFKLISILFFIIAGQSNAFAQTTAQDTFATIYFLRETGYLGKAGAFKVFVNNDYLCKISDNRYITTTIEPGPHAVSAQYYGTTLKDNVEKFEFVAEAGKTYYFSVTQVTGAFVNNIFCEEVTEATGKNKLKGLRYDPDCR